MSTSLALTPTTTPPAHTRAYGSVRDVNRKKKGDGNVRQMAELKTSNSDLHQPPNTKTLRNRSSFTRGGGDDGENGGTPRPRGTRGSRDHGNEIVGADWGALAGGEGGEGGEDISDSDHGVDVIPPSLVGSPSEQYGGGRGGLSAADLSSIAQLVRREVASAFGEWEVKRKAEAGAVS